MSDHLLHVHPDHLEPTSEPHRRRPSYRGDPLWVAVQLYLHEQQALYCDYLPHEVEEQVAPAFGIKPETVRKRHTDELRRLHAVYWGYCLGPADHAILRELHDVSQAWMMLRRLEPSTPPIGVVSSLLWMWDDDPEMERMLRTFSSYGPLMSTPAKPSQGSDETSRPTPFLDVRTTARTLAERVRPRKAIATSPHLAAVLSFILDKKWVTPIVNQLEVAEDGCVLMDGYPFATADELDAALERSLRVGEATAKDCEEFEAKYLSRVVDARPVQASGTPVAGRRISFAGLNHAT